MQVKQTVQSFLHSTLEETFVFFVYLTIAGRFHMRKADLMVEHFLGAFVILFFFVTAFIVILGFQCLSTHMLCWGCMCKSYWIAVCSMETAAFWLVCDSTCCCCNNLIISACSCTYCTGYERLGSWERATRWDGHLGPTVCLGCSGDGRTWEWLRLQSELACHTGGGASVRGTSLRYDECKIDKDSLICADRGKTHWLPQQLLLLVLGELI